MIGTSEPFVVVLFASNGTSSAPFCSIFLFRLCSPLYGHVRFASHSSSTSALRFLKDTAICVIPYDDVRKKIQHSSALMNLWLARKSHSSALSTCLCFCFCVWASPSSMFEADGSIRFPKSVKHILRFCRSTCSGSSVHKTVIASPQQN